MHRLVSLCLACSSSLPPKVSDIFLTPCCVRPICPACLSSNPRLGRYNPCLSCLGGIEVIRASSSRNSDAQNMNIDGAVRDVDTFVLGDDDDGELDGLEAPLSIGDNSLSMADPPPSYTSTPTHTMPKLTSVSSEDATLDHNARKENGSIDAPPLYYIKPGDTLRGIALRLGVNEHELCRLNNLPASTLSTTPHLLHTRTSLKLPLSACPQSNSTPASGDRESEARRVRKRAEKQLQTLTKEVDWRVARAYVSLADDPEEEVAHATKFKELGLSSDRTSLSARAVDRYFEDEEWEEEQRRAGRNMSVVTTPPLKIR
ncbi:hypothetical protein F5I97DRAFT_1812853 [Phlebopus sp. FC_14]|nr:hypothetical protein F5I97DRAFT_1812853 [Phlebopus sp. FC_14]